MRFPKVVGLFLGAFVMTYGAMADTMDHYLGIVNNIPKMEIKADGQAQIWARSARNVLLLTCESVAETLVVANVAAAHQGVPLFCLPGTVILDGSLVHDIVQQTYRDISSQENDKSKMTVSQVALLGLIKSYPCTPAKVEPTKKPNIRLIRRQG